MKVRLVRCSYGDSGREQRCSDAGAAALRSLVARLEEQVAARPAARRTLDELAIDPDQVMTRQPDAGCVAASGARQHDGADPASLFAASGEVDRRRRPGRPRGTAATRRAGPGLEPVAASVGRTLPQGAGALQRAGSARSGPWRVGAANRVRQRVAGRFPAGRRRHDSRLLRRDASHHRRSGAGDGRSRTARSGRCWRSRTAS